MNGLPDTAILTSLQDLLDAYLDEDFVAAVEHCSNLLKRRKSLGFDIADAVQRLLLQCYIQQKDYSKIREFNSKSNDHRDLVLYAQYREEEYEAVSQQASKESALEQHLLAQSYYHLNQTNPAIRVYQDMLKEEEVNEDDHLRMQILTNALAVISSTVVPYVPYVAPDNALLEEAGSFLSEHPEYCDLALNLGTLECLTGSPGSQWLAKAKKLCTDPTDSIPIEMNINWSNHFWQTEDTALRYNNEGSAPLKAVAQLNQCLLNDKPIANLPHPKWNNLQVRMYWYNRAVQQYQSQMYVECQESCQSLKKSVGTKNKKKGGPATVADLWWLSRVEAILAQVLKQQGKQDAAVSKLEDQIETLKSLGSNETLDHALAFLQLQLHSILHPDATLEEKLITLKALPHSVRSQPAVVATMASLEKSSGSNGSKTPTDEADAKFQDEKYAEAADLYERHLPDPSACNTEQLSLQLNHVQALALSNQHEKSVRLWATIAPLLSNDGGVTLESLSGEDLEKEGLPRNATKAASGALAATGTNEDTNPKRSKESILRQRAKKREAYLKALEEKGDYNPDRPTKPNPERWIPKHERSRARRRGQNSRSAQGGGSQADSLRLDAAARRAGVVASSAGPSTASIKVSQGGRKGGRRR